mgnify:CR=1 FL=1
MELISVLILSYAVSGDIHESEITMRHDQCVAAEKAVSRALLGPRDGMPTVELLSGDRVPVLEGELVAVRLEMRRGKLHLGGVAQGPVPVLVTSLISPDDGKFAVGQAVQVRSGSGGHFIPEFLNQPGDAKITSGGVEPLLDLLGPVRIERRALVLEEEGRHPRCGRSMARIKFGERIGVHVPLEVITSGEPVLAGSLHKVRRREKRGQPMGLAATDVLSLIERI